MAASMSMRVCQVRYYHLAGGGTMKSAKRVSEVLPLRVTSLQSHSVMSTYVLQVRVSRAISTEVCKQGSIPCSRGKARTKKQSYVVLSTSPPNKIEKRIPWNKRNQPVFTTK